MKRNRMTLLVAVSLMTLSVMAVPRTKEQMKQAAAKAINTHLSGRQMAPVKANELKTLKTAEGYEVLGNENGGFAVISKDDVAPEVLGVSHKKYNAENTNFQWWLSAINHVVSQAADNGTVLTTTKPDPAKYPTSVPPMLTTEWDQDAPYSDLCPTAYGSVKCLTGCVATALAQVLNYFKTPVHGIGQHTIYHNGTPVTANFEEDYYDWDNMLDKYIGQNYNEQQAQAVALLMRDCGVASDMEYGSPSEGSGAYSTDAASGMRTYFGFAEAECLERDYYNEPAWMDIVYRELSETGPIYYGGASWSSGGHAFVLHGYNSDGKVYVNWGWSGDDDGYYDIALLNPSYYDFSMGQDMIIGIKGDPLDLTDEVVSLTTAGTLGNFISDEKIGTVGTLKVSGDINSTDLCLLRKMAGVDEYGERTKGYLHELDLSEARFVSGGYPYLYDGSKQLTTADDELPARAFYGCRQLRVLKLPAGIKVWGEGALALCSSLGNIEIGTPAVDANFIIEDKVVWNNDQTEIIAVLPSFSGEYEIPKGTTTLHDYAMAGCSRITKVILPSTIELIGREAFRSATGLEQLRVATKEAPALGGADVFTGITISICKLYVPSGSKTKYAQKAQWSIFKGDNYDNIVEYGSTVKVRNTIRPYGDENPELTYTVVGDPIEGEPVLTCEATPLSPAGRYPITISAGTITDENVELEDGYLVVKRVDATATVEDCTRAMGEPNPEFTLVFSGLKNDETEPVWKVEPVITTTADQSSPAGEYPITVESGQAESYIMTFIAGTLTVTMPTAISEVPTEGKADSNAVYDLTGRKMPTALRKGIYIRNGKALVIK